MYQHDYDLLNSNDYSDTHSDLHGYDNTMKELERQKRLDKGYNCIYRRTMKYSPKYKCSKLMRVKIEVFSSDGYGSHIRDAETGDYFPNIVGSRDEDLFFKVILATGECNSKNGSSTLFFVSPQHYSTHMFSDVDPTVVHAWEQKRDARLAELNKAKRSHFSMVEVK